MSLFQWVKHLFEQQQNPYFTKSFQFRKQTGSRGLTVCREEGSAGGGGGPAHPQGFTRQSVKDATVQRKEKEGVAQPARVMGAGSIDGKGSPQGHRKEQTPLAGPSKRRDAAASAGGGSAAEFPPHCERIAPGRQQEPLAPAGGASQPRGGWWSLSRLTAAVRMFVTHKRWCARLAAGGSGRLCLKPLRLVAPRTAPLWRGGIRLVQLPWPRLASQGVQMRGQTGSHSPSSWRHQKQLLDKCILLALCILPALCIPSSSAHPPCSVHPPQPSASPPSSVHPSPALCNTQPLCTLPPPLSPVWQLSWGQQGCFSPKGQ